MTRLENVKNVIDGTPADPGELQPESESAFQLVEVAMREYHLFRDTICNELEDLHGLVTGSPLYQKVSLVLVDRTCTIRKAWGKASSSYVVCSEEDVETALTFKSSAIAPGGYGGIFYWYQLYF